jgi:hypothetical protein
VRQHAQQSVAVWQCGTMRHITAICGSASDAAVRLCVAVRAATVCGSVRQCSSVRQAGRPSAEMRQCAAVRAAVCGIARDCLCLFLFNNYIICV